MKRFLSALVFATGISLILSSCSGTTPATHGTVIPLSERVTVTSVPEWDASSVTVLKDAGWDVVDQKKEASSEGITMPQMYYATSKDKACTVAYSISFDQAIKMDTSEDFLTHYMLYGQLSGIGVTDLSKMQESQLYVDIKGQDYAMEMLGAEYSRPRMVSESIEVGSNDINPPKEDGVWNTATAVRVLSTNLYDPAFGAADREGSNWDKKKSVPVMLITYECTNQDIDKSLWTKIVETAVISADFKDPKTVTK